MLLVTTLGRAGSSRGFGWDGAHRDSECGRSSTGYRYRFCNAVGSGLPAWHGQACLSVRILAGLQIGQRVRTAVVGACAFVRLERLYVVNQCCCYSRTEWPSAIKRVGCVAVAQTWVMLACGAGGGGGC